MLRVYRLTMFRRKKVQNHLWQTQRAQPPYLAEVCDVGGPGMLRDEFRVPLALAEVSFGILPTWKPGPQRAAHRVMNGNAEKNALGRVQGNANLCNATRM
jgi:hypothetical protein